MRLSSIDLEFLYHLEVKWKPGGQKNCETFALQFGSCERNNVCVYKQHPNHLYPGYISQRISYTDP